ncbi:MAG: pilus assembly protein PilM [Patescibacteria group bacterium]
MGLLSKQISYVGVDLGSASIKIVELANINHRPKLITYGFTEKKLAGWAGEDALERTEETAQVIKDVYSKARIGSSKAIAALPNFSVFTSILNLPEMPKKELASAIGWEAKKIIPMPLEDIILDWKVIKETAEDGKVLKNNGINPGAEINLQEVNSFKKIFTKPKKNLKILLTGASKNLVKKYIDIFRRSGLNLLSLETESFALIRSLVGNDKSIIMLVDLGATTSSITVVDGGVPVLSRSIEVGGMMITKAVSASLNVNLERAEQFKQDMSLGGEEADNSLPQIVERSFSSIFNEIKYTVNLYQEQNNKKIEKIILTGGSALLGNLTGYLSRALNINTYIGDPWSRVIFPTELKPILDRLGARFAVAIGLAMRNIE